MIEGLNYTFANAVEEIKAMAMEKYGSDDDEFCIKIVEVLIKEVKENE